jgi:hypothetical protein
MEDRISHLTSLPTHSDMGDALAAVETEASSTDVSVDVFAKSDGSRARKGKTTRAKKAKNKAGKGKAKGARSAKDETAPKPPRVLKEKAPAFELSDEHRAKLRNVGLLIRRNADNTFDIGAALAELQPSIPEKSWGKVIRPLGLTTRSAWNYMSVSRCLSQYRADLIDADIGQTVLYQLARAPEALIRIVIDTYHGGERLGVAAVKRMVDDALGIEKKPKASAIDVGGLCGIRRAAMEKLRADSAELIAAIKRILVALDVALKPLRDGKRVNKGALADAITGDCRTAHRLIRGLAAPFDGRDFGKPPVKTGWGAAQVLLDQMGSEGNWPTRTAFEPWLTETVLPTLRFIVDGKAAATPDIAAEAPQVAQIGLEPTDATPEPVAAVEPESVETQDPERSEAKILAGLQFESASIDVEAWRMARALRIERSGPRVATIDLGEEHAPQDETSELVPSA